MGKKVDYNEKFNQMVLNVGFDRLSKSEAKFIEKIAKEFHFSFQELREVVEISVDLKMWDEGSVEKLWVDSEKNDFKSKKRDSLTKLRLSHERLKNRAKK